MLYNIDIWLEIVGTIWISAESSNFGCAQVKIFMRSVYKKPRACIREKSSSVSRFQRFVEPLERTSGNEIEQTHEPMHTPNIAMGYQFA
jgi:hypothetical protein